MSNNEKVAWYKVRYIWLAFFGFVFLMSDTSRRINPLKDNGFDLWVRACGNFFKLGFLYFFLPPFILGFLGRHIFPNSESLQGFILFSGWYLCCVRAAYAHHVWRSKNINHLLPEKKKEEPTKADYEYYNEK